MTAHLLESAPAYIALKFSHFTSPHLILYHLISSHLTSPHLISYHIISSHITSSHLILSSHLISYHIISSHLTSPHIISPHLISSNLISSDIHISLLSSSSPYFPLTLPTYLSHSSPIFSFPSPLLSRSPYLLSSPISLLHFFL